MATGFRNSAGTDFDALFDPYVSGTKPANTGFRTSDGTDLKDRFAPISVGLKGPDVGYRTSGGADLSTLWAAAGTAVYNVTAQSLDQSATGAATSASIAVQVLTNGTIEFVCSPGSDPSVIYHNPPGTGVGSAYEARISGTVNGLRNSTGATASMTGKNGISFTAAVYPGNSAPFDTGWQDPDDSNNFLTMQANSSGNNGLGQVYGTATVQVRRKSDSVVVRSFSLGFECSADSQL